VRLIVSNHFLMAAAAYLMFFSKIPRFHQEIKHLGGQAKFRPALGIGLLQLWQHLRRNDEDSDMGAIDSVSKRSGLIDTS